jgi:hypothetical protein
MRSARTSRIRPLAVRCLGRAAIALLAWLVASPAPAQSQLWVRQLGSSAYDHLTAAAPDGSGGVYASGFTEGSLGGPYAGNGDVWVARYDNAGTQLWIRQLGSSEKELGTPSATDGSGGVYIAGSTSGSLGGPSAGGSDAWLARYDGAGTQLWILQLGSGSAEGAWAVASDGVGGVFVGGWTLGSLAAGQAGGGDVWFARYDGAGNQLWIQQFGTSLEDGVSSASPDGSGGVYLVGNTAGNLAGPNAGGYSDIWLGRYDSMGNSLWTRQFGTNETERPQAAAADVSGVYLGGFTWGSLAAPHAGQYDAWLARYDGAGGQAWIRQLGTSAQDNLSALAPDGLGGVFAAGYTDGRLGGTKIGSTDAWLARYDAPGNELWSLQIGTYDTNYAFAAAPDPAGGIYIGGSTAGDFGGPNAGGMDAWLARYETPCFPYPVYCTAKTNSAGCAPAISGTGNPSTSAGSGFTIRTVKVLGNKFGLYFYGKSGPASVPFQGGFLCAQTPLVRTALQDSGGYAPCGGLYKLDFNAYVAGGKDPGLVAGQQVWIQSWSRDPGFAPPDNTSLSDALTFTLCP